jgi:hypothetical protein
MTLRALLGVLLVAGCFHPIVMNDGFSCAPTDDPPCPSGYYCVRGLCVDTPDEHDASVHPGPVGDLGSDDHGHAKDLATAARDLVTTPPDLTQTQSPDLRQSPDLAQARDLATQPPDLWTGVCGHAGAPCTSIDDCCSQYCRTDGICIGG